jgi:hypothetical protein
MFAIRSPLFGNARNRAHIGLKFFWRRCVVELIRIFKNFLRLLVKKHTPFRKLSLLPSSSERTKPDLLRLKYFIIATRPNQLCSYCGNFFWIGRDTNHINLQFIEFRHSYGIRERTQGDTIKCYYVKVVPVARSNWQAEGYFEAQQVGTPSWSLP